MQRGISYVAFVAHEEHHLGARILRKALGTLSSSLALSLPGRVERNLSACFPRPSAREGVPNSTLSMLRSWRHRSLPLPASPPPCALLPVGPRNLQSPFFFFHKGPPVSAFSWNAKINCGAGLAEGEGGAEGGEKGQRRIASAPHPAVDRERRRSLKRGGGRGKRGRRR